MQRLYNIFVNVSNIYRTSAFSFQLLTRFKTWEFLIARINVINFALNSENKTFIGGKFVFYTVT